jgi:S1-C subfamily serine protease
MNIPSGFKDLVAGATFKIHTKERGSGQCVLVEGGLILTAAHCVDWDCTGKMALGEFYFCTIKTGNGDLIASTLAVEPVSDIAVLGRPDDQTVAVAFDEFCERVAPVQLLRKTPKKFEPFPVWIRTHLKTWVSGTATHNGWNSTFAFNTDRNLLGGTSGGPIVNNAGELVGVVSNSPFNRSQGTTNCTQVAGLLSLALPAWIITRTTHAN